MSFTANKNERPNKTNYRIITDICTSKKQEYVDKRKYT